MSTIINTILVDDEKNSLIILEKLLEKHCPEVEIVATAQSVDEAVKVIDENHPQLVFLDINMPEGDGFEVLDKVAFRDFQVVFITAYDKYAIKAFEFSALHYLLKPVKHEELIEAVNRFKENTKDQIETEKISLLHQNMKNPMKKIILPSSESLTVVDLDNIVRCESSNNYTTFYLADNDKILVSKSINIYEHLLADLNFVRVHNKHLINLKYVKRYLKGRGGEVVLHNGMKVDVSEGRKKEFIEKLNEYAKGLI